MKLGILLTGFSFLIGCTLIQTPSVPRFEPDQYAIEIAKLEAEVLQGPEAANRGKAHYKLALLHNSYKNPRRDYKKAFENLERHLAHHPASLDDDDLQNWLSILYEIQRQLPRIESQEEKIEQLTTNLEQSMQDNLLLQQAYLELEKSSKELATKFEILKTLDHRVEEKRKSYKSE
jgi:hypothetical protein